MDVSAALVAGPEALEGVQPGEATLDHPPLAAQARAMGDAAATTGRYDLVAAFECIHDMPNPVAVLGAMRRLA